MEKDNRKKQELKALLKLALHFWWILVVANIGIVAIIRYISVAQTSCIPRNSIASDSRCLYILGNKVFEKGTHSNPHQGHPCGMDVTSIIPAFHNADAARYLDPNYRGDICTTQPTPQPTPAPTPTATPNPTPIPTLIPSPSIAFNPTPLPSTLVNLTPTPTPGIGGQANLLTIIATPTPGSTPQASITNQPISSTISQETNGVTPAPNPNNTNLFGNLISPQQTPIPSGASNNHNASANMGIESLMQRVSFWLVYIIFGLTVLTLFTGLALWVKEKLKL